MEKRKISAVFLIIFVLVLVLVTGCSKQNKTEEPKLGRYVIQGTEPEGLAWVLLNENKQFVFNRGAITSYRPSGTYSIKNKVLTLYVNEDESYIFSIEGEKLVFQSGKFAENLVEKGAVFKLSDKE